MTNQPLDADGYPLVPDAAFEGQAIELMMKKQQQLNDEAEKAANPAVHSTEAKVEEPAVEEADEKVLEKIETPTPIVEPEEKTGPTYATITPPEPPAAPKLPDAEVLDTEGGPAVKIVGEYRAGGRVIAHIEAAINRPNVEVLDIIDPSFSADVGLKITQAAMIKNAEGDVVDMVNPVTEGWKYVENLPNIFFGNVFSGGNVRRLAEGE